MPQSRWTFGHIQSAIRKTIRNEHLLLVGLGLVVGCIAGAAGMRISFHVSTVIS